MRNGKYYKIAATFRIMQKQLLFSWVRFLNILSQQPHKEYEESKNEFKNLNELQSE